MQKLQRSQLETSLMATAINIKPTSTSMARDNRSSRWDLFSTRWATPCLNSTVIKASNDSTTQIPIIMANAKAIPASGTPRVIE